MNSKQLFVFTLSAALPGGSFAHSFGEPYQLPMPYWMYIFAAVAALVLSFIVLAFVIGNDHAKRGPRRWPAPQLQPMSWTRRLKPLCAAVFFLCFLLAVITGFLGSIDPYRNFNMTFFWVIFGLGAPYLTLLIGNWYGQVNPWATLTQLINRVIKGFDTGRFSYPAGLSYWPAVLLYVAFIGLELFGHIRPFSLSVLLVAYTAINLVAVWLIGANAWFRYGELFSVMFRLWAKCAPVAWERHEDNRIRMVFRLPFTGLIGQRIEHISLLVFLLFMLSSTAYDGLRETKVWFQIFWQDPFNLLTPLLGEPPIRAYVWLRPWYVAFESVCLVLSPFLYLLLFWAFLWLGKRLTRSRHTLKELSLRFGFSLLPIAIVYHVTHYYTLLLNQGVKIRALISDPFGWGWDLFGTTYTARVPLLPDMGFVWNSQTVLILLGHVASVYLAHVEALTVFRSPRQATLSQLPMLGLMVLFTGAGLWILAQPLQG